MNQDPERRIVTRHRRRRVAPESRKRVASACNSCNVRRIKCSGERPCAQCARSSRTCLYPDAVEMVSIPRAELDALLQARSEQEGTGSRPADARQLREPMQAAGRPSSRQLGPLAAAPDGPSPLEVLTPDEGRLLHDPDGTARYFGESSGANFLNHVKEFMVTLQPLVTGDTSFLMSVGSYQTYDSRPLGLRPVDSSWLPTRTEMTVLLTEFRYFLQDGNGDFPSGGILFCGQLPMTPPNPNRAAELKSAGQLAVFHMLFAISVRLGAGTGWEEQEHRTSGAFYSRARSLLGNPLDMMACSEREVPALLLIALYFLEMNRRDAAYMTVSVALHLAVMYGAHTTWGYDEEKKRIFWTLFILDTWLSSWLGRPPSVIDTAIRIQLPQDRLGLPDPMGLIAHVKLARISRYVTCDIYRIAPSDPSTATSLQHVEKALHMLHGWNASLPRELCLDYENLSQDRACCVLHLAFNQEIILTTRPIFFIAVKKAVADRYISSRPLQGTDDHPHAEIMQQIVTTAHNNLRLGRWVRDLSPRQRLLHHEAHAVFNATVVVLLQQLAFANASMSPQDKDEIDMAIEIFEKEAASGNNFGSDCARVLQDLTYLVGRVQDQTPIPDPGSDLPMLYPSAGSEIDGLHSELQGWLDYDFLQLYNDHML
ncbi:unnamed protein product [Clonostachys rosea]|uniref:Zn(2)-C6 fungal-type domain-containing protein n=1 Tax=Bionectria ochroleuca TaxID=29856 RepID=A0ABY6V4C6_BIOOC|nr:unnamed protein product [Clonostachys rosea]